MQYKDIVKSIKRLADSSYTSFIGQSVGNTYATLPKVFFNNTFMVDVPLLNSSEGKKYSLEVIGTGMEKCSEKLDLILKLLQSEEIPYSQETAPIEDESDDDSFDCCYKDLEEFVTFLSTVQAKDKPSWLVTMRRIRRLLRNTSNERGRNKGKRKGR